MSMSWGDTADYLVTLLALIFPCLLVALLPRLLLELMGTMRVLG